MRYIILLWWEDVKAHPIIHLTSYLIGMLIGNYIEGMYR